MTRIILRGCNGRMGQAITQLLDSDDKAQIVAGIDITGEKKNNYPVFSKFKDCDIEADVIIDFSSPNNTEEEFQYAKDNNLPIVLCTTGFSEDQNKIIKELSNDIAILQSANMSIGVNTLIKLLKSVSKALAESGFDIEIVEKHHNQKLDAPSGTALALANAINETLNNEYNFVYDRSQVRQKRDEKEIGISAVRGGSIVGDHEVIYAGVDEVIELKHTAYSRNVFAKGAISAGIFLANKKPGLYNMEDLLG